MQDSVNPSDFDWQTPGRGLDLSDLRRTWEEMLVTKTEHSDATKKVEHLNDDLQLLFVSLLLEHVDEIFRSWEAKKQPKPLRLFLLGTAGTGKRQQFRRPCKQY